jgi:hypothetical protein
MLSYFLVGQRSSRNLDARSQHSNANESVNNVYNRLGLCREFKLSTEWNDFVM